MHTIGHTVWEEKLKITENDKHIVGQEIWQKKTLKNLEKKKCTLQDLEYGEKTENHLK